MNKTWVSELPLTQFNEIWIKWDQNQYSNKKKNSNVQLTGNAERKKKWGQMAIFFFFKFHILTIFEGQKLL